MGLVPLESNSRELPPSSPPERAQGKDPGGGHLDVAPAAGRRPRGVDRWSTVVHQPPSLLFFYIDDTSVARRTEKEGRVWDTKQLCNCSQILSCPFTQDRAPRASSTPICATLDEKNKYQRQKEMWKKETRILNIKSMLLPLLWLQYIEVFCARERKSSDLQSHRLKSKETQKYHRLLSHDSLPNVLILAIEVRSLMSLEIVSL